MQLTDEHLSGMPVAAWMILQGLIVKMLEKGLLVPSDIDDIVQPLGPVFEQVAEASPDQAPAIRSASASAALFLDTIRNMRRMNTN